MSHAIRNGVMIFLITAIIAAIGNYCYAWIAFHISIDATYYTDPATNQTVIHAFIYNSGFMTIDELDYLITNDCNLPWYGSKISGDDGMCTQKESMYFTGHCNEMSVTSGLDLRIKSIEPPPLNCSVKVSYEVDWPGLFFRLSSSDVLTPSNHPVLYGDERKSPSSQPTINFTFITDPMRKVVYPGGRAIIVSKVITNYSGSFMFTGEWFNSASIFDATTLITKEPHVGRFNLTEYQIKPYYHWTSVPLDQNAISFKGTLKDDSNNYYQADAIFTVSDQKDLYIYLYPDNLIKYDDPLTLHAIEKIKNVSSDEEIAKILLAQVRELMTVPREISKQIYYDENELDSITTFTNKEGTSSEYNALYVAFLRSVGIPAKMNSYEGQNYSYSEVYLPDRGWVAVDVYDLDYAFGSCLIDCPDDGVVIDLTK